MKPDDLLRKVAEEHGLDFVNLNEVVIPPSVVDLVPESVARENLVLPLAENKDSGILKVIVSDPLDYDTREKLRFTLNRNIEIAMAPRDMILESINKHYGQVDG
jgi:type IV pilus assembly protein PilB